MCQTESPKEINGEPEMEQPEVHIKNEPKFIDHHTPQHFPMMDCYGCGDGLGGWGAGSGCSAVSDSNSCAARCMTLQSWANWAPSKARCRLMPRRPRPKLLLVLILSTIPRCKSRWVKRTRQCSWHCEIRFR